MSEVLCDMKKGRYIGREEIMEDGMMRKRDGSYIMAEYTELCGIFAGMHLI